MLFSVTTTGKSRESDPRGQPEQQQPEAALDQSDTLLGPVCLMRMATCNPQLSPPGTLRQQAADAQIRTETRTTGFSDCHGRRSKATKLSAEEWCRIGRHVDSVG